MKKSERTRQRILEAASRLFYQQGYHATSFTQVVDASNVPRGNIYYYYRSKEDLLRGVIEYRRQRLAAMLQGWSESLRTPLERLRRFVEILPDSADSLVRYGCPIGSLNAELGKIDARLQAEASSIFRLFEDWLADQFAELGYAGRARELAQRLLARGQGINLLTHALREPQFLLRETALLRHWIDRLAAGDDRCD